MESHIPQVKEEGFKTGETNFEVAVHRVESFTRFWFTGGVELNLLDNLIIPETLPWRRIIPIYVPLKSTTRRIYELLYHRDLYVASPAYEDFSIQGSFCLVEDSISPSQDTLGHRLMDMFPEGGGGPFGNVIDSVQYALAFYFRYDDSGDCLDTDTATLFPDWCYHKPIGRSVGRYFGYAKSLKRKGGVGYEIGTAGEYLQEKNYGARKAVYLKWK